VGASWSNTRNVSVHVYRALVAAVARTTFAFRGKSLEPPPLDGSRGLVHPFEHIVVHRLSVEDGSSRPVHHRLLPAQKGLVNHSMFIENEKVY
jgi:hypothetical protein